MNKKILLLTAVVIAAGSFIFFKNQQTPKPEQPKTQKVEEQNGKARIVSTKPEPLEEAIISGTQVIEITFNKPLENVGEFKNRIEPKVDYKVELTSDRKTAKIMPVDTFELGYTYTLFIGTQTKFDGVGEWGEEKIFHFKTIKYTGV